MNKKFDEIDWDVERMIVLTYGHVYMIESMDYHMEINKYYEGSTKGGWISIKPLLTIPSSIKTCPACQTPIKNIKRYGRIIKKCTLDMQTRNFFQKYDQKLKNLVKEIRFYNRFERINLKNQLKTIYTMDMRSKDIIFKDFDVKIVNRALPEIICIRIFYDVCTTVVI